MDSLLCFVKPQDGGDSTEPLGGDGVVMGADVFFFLHGLVEKRGGGPRMFFFKTSMKMMI